MSQSWLGGTLDRFEESAQPSPLDHLQTNRDFPEGSELEGCCQLGSIRYTRIAQPGKRPSFE